MTLHPWGELETPISRSVPALLLTPTKAGGQLRAGCKGQAGCRDRAFGEGCRRCSAPCLEMVPHQSWPCSWGAGSSSQPALGQPVHPTPPHANPLPSTKVTVGLRGAADGTWPRQQMGCEWPSLLVLTSQIDAGTESVPSPSAATPSPFCILAWLLLHTRSDTWVPRDTWQPCTAPHVHRKVHKGLESSKNIYCCLGVKCGCSSACMCNSKKQAYQTNTYEWCIAARAQHAVEPGMAFLWHRGQILVQPGREGALHTPVQRQEELGPPCMPVKCVREVHVHVCACCTPTTHKQKH